jgi:hypothetical protein
MTDVPWYRGLWNMFRSPRLLPFIEVSKNFFGLVVLSSGLASIGQGLDYVVRPQDSSFALTVLERAIPLDYWGWSFILFASFAVIGGIFDVWPLAIFGHGALAACYVAFGVGVGWSLLTDWHGYGWQLGLLYFGVGMFHAMVADGCYDEWAKEWKKPPPPVELKGVGDGHGHTGL